MSFQPELIHESIYDAMRDAVRAAGGSKKVGTMLWPAKSVTDATDRVNHCVNPNREEKFALTELLFILRAARESGYHGAMQFIAAECGYRQPDPLEPQDEQAALQREYIESVKAAQRIAARLHHRSGRATLPYPSGRLEVGWFTRTADSSRSY